MSKKTTNFNKTNIGKLPNDKPVLYDFQTSSGNTNYAGIAKKGRVKIGLPSIFATFLIRSIVRGFLGAVIFILNHISE